MNVIGGWISFAIAMFVYGSTIEPTTSFWDCGEYIATSYKLEVGHPPGAPTFMMLGRIFSMFASPEGVAYMINMLSALSSALTILFMFWSLSYLALKMVKSEALTDSNKIASLGSAFIGSMAFTFSDTFWFSAVEGEVYGMSMLCTAVVFWAILRWDKVADEPNADRWLVFIWYIIGLSIGVHLLNLLAIPAIIFVYYFRKYKPNIKGILIAFGISVFTLGFVQMVLIPQIINIAAKFELVSVNSFGLPFHLGTAIFGMLIIGGLAALLFYTHKNKKVILNTLTLCFTVLLIGYTTFAMIMIRSNANTPIDENNPETLVNLLAYLNREQYGELPLTYGQYWGSALNSRTPYTDGKPVYRPNHETGEYEVIDNKKSVVPNYDKRLMMPFPRMWSSKDNHARAYKVWSDFKGKSVNVNGQNFKKPTMGENLKFFFRYQVWWMWGRYLMWNFAGRQNDIQGHGIDPGRFTDGNWVSGIPFIDEARLGDMSMYPSELKNNKAYNKFYLLPLILGLVGLYFQYKYDPENSLVVLLLFIFTGLAIVTYLNNYPYQPRERDYAFVGSFFAFSFWIGLGVMGIYRALRDKVNPKTIAIAATAGTLLIPGIMAAEGWDDHDRSNRYTAREVAKNYLDSCAPNAILFTNGDNDTFPLWYVQEVEGYRTDVRVVNLMLLNTDWYIEQMARKAYDGDPIPISMEPKDYQQGTRDFIQYVESGNIAKDKYIDIRQIVNYITDDAKRVPTSSGKSTNVIPARNFKLTIDKEKVLANGTVSPDMADQIVDEIRWSGKGRYILKNELVVWDMLANFNWDRPLYFSITMGPSSFYGLEDYFQQEGFAFRLVPIKTKANTQMTYGRVATDIMKKHLMDEFEWGGYENPDVYLDENNLRFVTNMRFMFTRLAGSLADQNRKKEAEEVLDRCIKVAVNENTRYDGSAIQIVENYYKIGAYEKGNDLLKKITNREKEFLAHYMNMKREDFQIVKALAQRSFGVYSNLASLAIQRYPDCGLKDEMNAEYMSLAQEFQQRLQ